jgi:hypothetical protein
MIDSIASFCANASPVGTVCKYHNCICMQRVHERYHKQARRSAQFLAQHSSYGFSGMCVAYAKPLLTVLAAHQCVYTHSKHSTRSIGKSCCAMTLCVRSAGGGAAASKPSLGAVKKRSPSSSSSSSGIPWRSLFVAAAAGTAAAAYFKPDECSELYRKSPFYTIAQWISAQVLLPINVLY